MTHTTAKAAFVSARTQAEAVRLVRMQRVADNFALEGIEVNADTVPEANALIRGEITVDQAIARAKQDYGLI